MNCKLFKREIFCFVLFCFVFAYPNEASHVIFSIFLVFLFLKTDNRHVSPHSVLFLCYEIKHYGHRKQHVKYLCLNYSSIALDKASSYQPKC